MCACKSGALCAGWTVTAGISASVKSLALLLLFTPCIVAPAPPELVLTSVGWSEAKYYWQELTQGFVIDVEQCCFGPSDMAGSWQHFGGNGGLHDETLRSNEQFAMIAAFVLKLLRWAADAMRARKLRNFALTVVCAWGKDRSRLLIEDSCRTIRAVYPGLRIVKQHLSEKNRQQEIVHCGRLQSEGMSANLAIVEAKQCGHCKHQDTFPQLKHDMRIEMKEQYVDASRVACFVKLASDMIERMEGYTPVTPVAHAPSMLTSTQTQSLAPPAPMPKMVPAPWLHKQWLNHPAAASLWHPAAASTAPMPKMPPGKTNRSFVEDTDSHSLLGGFAPSCIIGSTVDTTIFPGGGVVRRNEPSDAGSLAGGLSFGRSYLSGVEHHWARTAPASSGVARVTANQVTANQVIARGDTTVFPGGGVVCRNLPSDAGSLAGGVEHHVARSSCVHVARGDTTVFPGCGVVRRNEPCDPGSLAGGEEHHVILHPSNYTMQQQNQKKVRTSTQLQLKKPAE